MDNHPSSTNARLHSTNSNAGTLITSQGEAIPRWLAPVQLLAAALWHGIKAVW